MPQRWCLDCGQLFDADATGTRRCPACQAAQIGRDRARRARSSVGRPSSSARGYDAAYRRARWQLLRSVRAAIAAGRPVACCRCGQAVTPGDVTADHWPVPLRDGGTQLAPAHAACNTGWNRR